MLVGAVLLSVALISGASTCSHQAKSLKTNIKANLTAVKGSCLLIPCNFTIEENQLTGHPTGIWTKNSYDFKIPENVVYNSTRQQNLYSMEFIGNLTEGNCTTIFSDLIVSYTGQYYFRIVFNDYQATASCDALHITVLESPPSPKLNVAGEQKENSSATLSCSAVTPCPHAPPKLSWNYSKNPTTTTSINNTNQILVTKIQDTLSDKDNGSSVKCFAEYPVKDGVTTAERDLVLDVPYSPKTSVTIHPAAFVPAGSAVNLTCQSRANPRVSNFTWFQRGTKGDTEVSTGEHYTAFNVTHSIVLFCMAQNPLGAGRSEDIQIGVSDQNYWIVSGVIIGSIVLVLIICFWKLQSRVRSTQWIQSRHQIPISDSSASSQHEDKEELHYGEIDFSKRNLDHTAAAVDNATQQQDIVYSEVHVFNASTDDT